ncbi:PTS sugar transporter subunit IIA [Paraliobacillus ryukyuensis]|uniref:PTS sugar transporter subunit IIA n=1 Tax=Paraliobacillus ryukyuensis TaxID=200904 RepID=UPI0009A7BCAB|nr:PTS sugar transporter subunit IIA [Paraliobacillus ryukyuensis]
MSSLQFDESLILKDMEVSSKEEAISLMADRLAEKGFVKSSYKQAVLEREEEFSTGLPTHGCSVAIPHTDSKHVNQKAISLAILKHPVIFGVMGECTTTPVKLIFMLAMDEEHSQLTLLQRLMQIFQNAEMLHYFCKETDKSKIKDKVLTQLEFSLKGGE